MMKKMLNYLYEDNKTLLAGVFAMFPAFGMLFCCVAWEKDLSVPTAIFGVHTPGIGVVFSCIVIFLGIVSLSTLIYKWYKFKILPETQKHEERMHRMLLDAGFVNTQKQLNWKRVWEKEQWVIEFDTSSQADLFIRNYDNKLILIQPIFGIDGLKDMPDAPVLGLRDTIKKYFNLYV